MYLYQRAEELVYPYNHTMAKFMIRVSELRNQLAMCDVKDEGIIVPPELRAENRTCKNPLTYIIAMRKTFFHDFMGVDGGRKKEVEIRSDASSSSSDEQWPYRKILTVADSNASKLCIPNDAAANYIVPHLMDAQRNDYYGGVSVGINVRDSDTGTDYSMKFMRESGTHYLRNGWTALMKARKLKHGHQIGLRCVDGQLYFALLG
ncbi:hypothetical protein HHK36_020050 [Tetracentron sinense]|uniref:TF-B3 domain-containing protein n=1 Tax=Tetracentron sinense TaxID=13715 RepID=A0A834YSX5_TETSI|nr:hypothetical protein HHK36_020050 [Tetracentron sinense]